MDVEFVGAKMLTDAEIDAMYEKETNGKIPKDEWVEKTFSLFDCQETPKSRMEKLFI